MSRRPGSPRVIRSLLSASAHGWIGNSPALKSAARSAYFLLTSSPNQIPDRSGFPSGLRGAGARRFGLPSLVFGILAGTFNHCPDKVRGLMAKIVVKTNMPATLVRNPRCSSKENLQCLPAENSGLVCVRRSAEENWFALLRTPHEAPSSPNAANFSGRLEYDRRFHGCGRRHNAWRLSRLVTFTAI